MRYKVNDIINIVSNLYEVMAILTIKNIPGYDSDIFYHLRNLTTDDKILLEAKSIDQEDISFLDTQYMREQRLNKILK